MADRRNLLALALAAFSALVSAATGLAATVFEIDPFQVTAALQT